MRNALGALAFSLAAMVASMIIGDMVISMITVIASVIKVAHAYDVNRRFATLAPRRPVRHIRPYQFQFMR